MKRSYGFLILTITLLLSVFFERLYWNRRVINSGIINSYLSSLTFLIILSQFVFLVLLLVLIYKLHSSKLESYFLIIILSGAFYNFIERIIYNGVVDYWIFPVILFYYNLPDILIGIGSILFAISIIMKSFKIKGGNRT